MVIHNGKPYSLRWRDLDVFKLAVEIPISLPTRIQFKLVVRLWDVNFLLLPLISHLTTAHGKAVWSESSDELIVNCKDDFTQRNALYDVMMVQNGT